MMDNYEMAHWLRCSQIGWLGHGVWAAASSELGSQAPHRHREPCLTSQSDFPPKPLSITESQYLLVFQVVCMWLKGLKNPQAWFGCIPPPGCWGTDTALITYTARQHHSQGCGVQTPAQKFLWLAGPDANQGEPRNSTEAEAMQHLLRTFRKESCLPLPPPPPPLFPLVLPADV